MKIVIDLWLNISILIKKSDFTYQLNSSKGLSIVIKGLDLDSEPTDIKQALQEKDFQVKAVVDIINKQKEPKPMFKIDLWPGGSKLMDNETHPIYDLRYLHHRSIEV